jgi:nondiscriminating aspartyl-tRNA synthetase
MERTLAAELSAHVGQRVRLAGWLHHQRQLAQVVFLLLRDRSGVAQVVLTERSSREALAELLAETVVEVEGSVVANERAPRGVELVDPAVEVVTEPTEAPPFELRRPKLNAQLPTLLDHAAVSLRHPARRALAQIAAASASGFRNALDQAGFTEIFTPKVVASATESGANVFPVDGSAGAPISPRARSSTSRSWLACSSACTRSGRSSAPNPTTPSATWPSTCRLTPEMGFIRDHHDVMRVLGDVLAAMLESILETAQPALRLLDLVLPDVPSDIPVVRFDESQRMIEASTGRATIGEPDLSPADERWLGEWAHVEHGSDFVFVTGFPRPSGPSTPTPTPPTQWHRTASTCCSAGWSSSRADSACTITRRTSTHSTARTSPPSRATSRHSATACPHTADSRLGSNAGSRGWPGPLTCAR